MAIFLVQVLLGADSEIRSLFTQTEIAFLGKVFKKRILCDLEHYKAGKFKLQYQLC